MMREMAFFLFVRCYPMPYLCHRQTLFLKGRNAVLLLQQFHAYVLVPIISVPLMCCSVNIDVLQITKL